LTPPRDTADKIAAALSLVKAGLSPTAAAKQLGLGRSTVYREVSRAALSGKLGLSVV
jgi:transposase